MNTRSCFLCLPILMLVVVTTGCDGGSSSPPAALASCGAASAKVKGTFGGTFPTSISTTANVTDTGSSITWQAAPGTTGRAIDGVPATGTIPVGGSTPRPFTATGTSGDYTLTVTGSVTGPPPTPCTASGNWQLKLTGTGQLVGSGTWSIP